MPFPQFRNQLLLPCFHPLAIFLYLPLHFSKLPRVLRKMLGQYLGSLLDSEYLVAGMGRAKDALRADIGISAIKTVIKCLLLVFVTLQSFFFGRLGDNRFSSPRYFLSMVLSNKRLKAADSFAIQQRLNKTDFALN